MIGGNRKPSFMSLSFATRRSASLLILLSLLVMGLCVACGSSPSSPASVVAIVASDTAFQVTGTLRIGSNTVNFHNSGTRPHGLTLARLRDGKTSDDYIGTLHSTNPSSATTLLYYFGGAPPVDPGSDARFTLELVSGQYLLVSTVKGKEEVDGPIGSFSPEPAIGKTVPPKADFEVRLDDTHAIPAPVKSRPGLRTFKAFSAGPSLHALHIWKLPVGKSQDDLLSWMRSDQSAPAPAQLLGGTGTLSVGESTWFSITLSAGTYVASDAFVGQNEASATAFTVK